MTDNHDIDREQVSSYLQYLPAPLQDGAFIGRFLLAFEAILTGVKATGEPVEDESEPARPQGIEPEWPSGLSDTLSTITAYFQPQRTPADFLPWLARWVAVDLREDWSEQTRRDVVASIVPLYTLRGTRRGIEQAVQLCVSETATVAVDDSDSANNPYHFQVTLTVATRQYAATIGQLFRKAEAAIELQKPAHTYYTLRLKYPSLVLLGKPDPALGDDPSKSQKRLATEGIYVAMNTVLGSVEMDPQTGEKLPFNNASTSIRKGASS